MGGMRVPTTEANTKLLLMNKYAKGEIKRMEPKKM